LAIPTDNLWRGDRSLQEIPRAVGRSKTEMGTKERQIIFMLDGDNVIHRVPLDTYESGDIRETKELLAKKLGCNPEDIKVKITGARNGKAKKGPSLNIQLIDGATIRHFFE
jgi:hypothetical protein